MKTKKLIMEKNRTINFTPKLFTVRDLTRIPVRISDRGVSDPGYWRWGDDNLFPDALALLSRRSTAHRRILNDKADYICGKGFNHADGLSALAALVACANGSGESLRAVLRKAVFDKLLFGNSFIEIVTDEHRSLLALYHQDASRCRVARDGRGIVMHHDWAAYREAEAKRLPLYPEFASGEDGCLHSVLHYKDYEPMFEHYGVPSYIAGMNVSAIAYKTDKWNISRLENSFQVSGVMMLDGGVDNEEQAAELVRTAERKFAGKPGQVMFMIKDCQSGDSSRFIPISTSSEGDWTSLHEQAKDDIVVAHSWFRSLSGLTYSAGFEQGRIVNEYEVALNTVILSEQAEILDPLKVVVEELTGEECSSLVFVNKPPTRTKEGYMKVWEARQADGLDYDPDDPTQQLYIAQLGTRSAEN